MAEGIDQQPGRERFDPRPVVTGTPPLIRGRRCHACRFPSLESADRCPVCGGAMAEVAFAVAGTVFSGTVLRIPVGERRPPLSLAYVDLDDGPRVLGHGQDPERALRAGERVVLLAAGPQGDPLFGPETP